MPAFTAAKRVGIIALIFIGLVALGAIGISISPTTFFSKSRAIKVQECAIVESLLSRSKVISMERSSIGVKLTKVTRVAGFEWYQALHINQGSPSASKARARYLQ